MSQNLPACPRCSSAYTYESGALIACSQCFHEWSPAADEPSAASAPVVRDAVGNVLVDGDAVTIVKDLKVKGAGGPIKVGTKVRGIRIVDGVGDHDLEAKVPGFGPMQLKSSVVRKA